MEFGSHTTAAGQGAWPLGEGGWLVLWWVWGKVVTEDPSDGDEAHQAETNRAVLQA